jgi:hypothetical protein
MPRSKEGQAAAAKILQTAFRAYSKRQRMDMTRMNVMAGLRFSDIVRIAMDKEKRYASQDAKELGEAFRIDGTWRHPAQKPRVHSARPQEDQNFGWMGLEHD